MPPRTSEHDPYRTFKFRVRIEDKTVAGVMKVTALGRTVTPTELKQGGDMLAPRQNPGAVTYDDVTLERAWTKDTAFEEWANAAARLHVDPADAKVKNFKRTVYIDVYDLEGNPQDRSSKPVSSYKLHRCWVTKYTAMPGLDAHAGEIGIQSIVLRHEGWERVI